MLPASFKSQAENITAAILASATTPCKSYAGELPLTCEGEATVTELATRQLTTVSPATISRISTALPFKVFREAEIITATADELPGNLKSPKGEGFSQAVTANFKVFHTKLHF